MIQTGTLNGQAHKKHVELDTQKRFIEYQDCVVRKLSGYDLEYLQAAVAQAALAYKLYQKKFSGPRWEALVQKGAKKQRLLWASTSVKNPAYADTLYVDPLIGPGTVSTMPDAALQAFIDHGVVSRTIDANLSEAEGIYNAIEKMGIDWNEVGSQLEVEGVDSFKKSFDSLLTSLKEKADNLKLVSL